MENATKALLIAGSILIAIILIATGMKVLNSTSGMTNSAQTSMEASEIATFNNRFSQMCGDNKKKSEVMALVNQIIANNAVNEARVIEFDAYSTEGYSRPGLLSGGSTTDSNIMLQVVNQLPNDYLTVSPTYGSNGYIWKITVNY